MGGEVAVFVGAFRDNNAVLRTYCHAQTTAFASFDINNYFAGHLLIFYTLDCYITELPNFSSAGRVCKVKRQLISDSQGTFHAHKNDNVYGMAVAKW